MKIHITKINSAEILIELRDQVENKTIRHYSNQDRFNLFKAHNEINKLHGYGETKDNCPACFHQKVLPQIRRWYKIWDESKEPIKVYIDVLDELRKKCDKLGIKYHHLHKEEKLKQLIQEANG